MHDHRAVEAEEVIDGFGLVDLKDAGRVRLIAEPLLRSRGSGQPQPRKRASDGAGIGLDRLRPHNAQCAGNDNPIDSAVLHRTLRVADPETLHRRKARRFTAGGGA